MNLEERIIKRWQQWWENRAFELSEERMRELIAITLEEVQKGMVEPRFTVKEASRVEHLLSTVQVLVSPELPITDKERINAIAKLITPEVLSALGKLHMELDNIKQTQELAVGFDSTPDTENVVGGEG